MSNISTLLQFQEHDLSISIDEHVYKISTEKDPSKRELLHKEYLKMDRLRHLYREAINSGWEEFDWKEAEKLGWLCGYDYIDFPKELPEGNPNNPNNPESKKEVV